MKITYPFLRRLKKPEMAVCLLATIVATGCLALPSFAATQLGIDSAPGTDMPLGASGVESMILGGGETVTAGNVEFLGKVGIGTAKPLKTLDINGNVNITSPTYRTGGGTVIISTNDPAKQTFYSVDNTATQSAFYAGADANDGNGWLGSKGSLKFQSGSWDVSATPEKMILSSLGNLGIGTNNPTSKLQVNGKIIAGTLPTYTNTDPNYQLVVGGPVAMQNMSGSRDGFFGIEIKSGSNYSSPSMFVVDRLSGGALDSLQIMNAAVSPVMTIKNTTGHVGIGTTNPVGVLDVEGDGVYSFLVPNNSGQTVNNMVLIGAGDGSSSNRIEIYGPNGRDGGYGLHHNEMYFSADRMYFRGKCEACSPYVVTMDAANNRLGVATTSPQYTLHVAGTAYAAGGAGALSDARHKDQVEALSLSGLDVVGKLRPVSFVWKNAMDDGMKGKQLGFIAQEVEKILPEVVLTEANDEKTKGLKYNEMIPVLTKAIQELKAINDKQAEQLEKQAGEIRALQQKVAADAK